ncbi:MAG: calcium/sodium antiporter [Oscillospiraceae bacterium]|nr:calcium/sodium antiporter [Oscillospiraceae bacterium]
MELFLNILLLAVGFLALIKGADFFVDGSSGLAKNFKVPGVIIGLTIVAMGTSAPELAVSTSAAIKGANEIALSNVTGSNIFNLLGVLGICAMIHPLPIEPVIMKRDFPLSIGISLLTLGAVGLPFLLKGDIGSAAMSDNVGEVSRIFSIILLILFVSYIAMLIHSARKSPQQEENSELKPLWKCALLILVGLACIIAGGQFVVNSAKAIAAAFGMSETLIGLTIVAIGTSLPELVTSVVASRKGENGLAVGNVVGSNIFNILFILGVSGTIHPIAVNLASVADLAVLVGVSIITMIFARTKNIGRAEGAVMVLIYAADVVFAVLR